MPNYYFQHLLTHIEQLSAPFWDPYTRDARKFLTDVQTTCQEGLEAEKIYVEKMGIMTKLPPKRIFLRQRTTLQTDTARLLDSMIQCLTRCSQSLNQIIDASVPSIHRNWTEAACGSDALPDTTSDGYEAMSGLFDNILDYVKARDAEFSKAQKEDGDHVDENRREYIEDLEKAAKFIGQSHREGRIPRPEAVEELGRNLHHPELARSCALYQSLRVLDNDLKDMTARFHKGRERWQAATPDAWDSRSRGK